MCYCTPGVRTPICANCARWLAEENTKLKQERDELAAQVEVLRMAAARYRFLRGEGGPASLRWPRWNIQHWTGFWNPVQGSEMDIAIDAALAQEETSRTTG